MIAMKNVLVATDFGEAADTALAYGRELARKFNATLHVLHVAENVYITAFGAETYASFAPDLQRDIEESANRRLKELTADNDAERRSVAAVMTSASPAFAIIDYANDHEIDLIVMGTHGRGTLGHFLMGSVAERVVRLASCPVLTVRQPERDFVHPDALVRVAAPVSA
ncbi:MAG TPA: universal stress protein [Vicinamibacterales bacterium]|nr:universal stress protein [Vicinamibacterales bacterium]